MFNFFPASSVYRLPHRFAHRPVLFISSTFLPAASMKAAFSFLLVLLSLLVAPKASAQVISLRFFDVKSLGASVQLAWAAQSESGISEYRLYKKLSTESEYSYVSTLPATGAPEYAYVDNDIFKENTLVINYELRVMKNGSTYKFYTTLSHNATSAQRTWGSIKSMFQ